MRKKKNTEMSSAEIVPGILNLLLSNFKLDLCSIAI